MTEQEREHVVITMAGVMGKPFEEALPIMRALVREVPDCITQSPSVMRWVKANAKALNEKARIK